MDTSKSLSARPRIKRNKKLRIAAALTMGLGALIVVVAGLPTIAAPPGPPWGIDGADDAGLRVIKEAAPDPVPAGARLTYTIRVTNTGATGLYVVITDRLPTSVTLGGVPGGTLVLPDGGPGVTWTADIAAPGAWTQTVAVTVAESYEGPLTNVVRVTSDEGPGAAYTQTARAVIRRPVYLPLLLRNMSVTTVLTGEYLRVGTPCTTDPCLPGLIYAVLVEDSYYYPTVEGAWLWGNRSWDGYTPEIGDIVRVTGCVSEMVDMSGAPFYNIEVISLEPVTAPPTIASNVVISDVVAYSAGSQDPGEYVEIRNDDTQPVPLEGWTLCNATHRTFTFPEYLIQPAQVCRIYTNEDHPEWCGFSFGSDSDVWNYAQDCAYLRDAEGALVDARCHCQSHTAYMTLSATTTTLDVGQAVTVTVTLLNRGCTGLGMPQYRLYVRTDESEPTLTPSQPEPVMHNAVGRGRSDAAAFALQAVSPGQAVLRATASFEVHLGYPGPAYWGYSGTGPLTITVTP